MFDGWADCSGDPETRQAFLAAGAVVVFSKDEALALRDWLGALVAA